jgi:hypothetical protein
MTGRLADPDIAGIIFTHGTNTIEETAYFMNLTVRSDKPVVIVGAQRPFSTLSSDGPLNLLNAIRVAADPASRGKGTLVVLNDEINAARDVTKTNTYRLETFQSRELGILGYADPDKIVFYRAPTRRHTTQSQFDLTQTGELPKVSILYGYAGDDGDLAKAAVAAGAKGLVIRRHRRRAHPERQESSQGALRCHRRGRGAQRQGRRRPGGSRRQLAGAGFRRCGQSEPAEGAYPSATGFDQDDQARRNPTDVRRILIRSQRRISAPRCTSSDRSGFGGRWNAERVGSGEQPGPGALRQGDAVTRALLQDAVAALARQVDALDAVIVRQRPDLIS